MFDRMHLLAREFDKNMIWCHFSSKDRNNKKFVLFKMAVN